MVQIRCTQKLIKEIGLKDSELSEVKSDGAMLGVWYANLFKMGRYKNVIFVNEETLFSFVALSVKKKDGQNLSSVFSDGLEFALRTVKISREDTESIKAKCEEPFEITKTADRKVQGNVNDLTYHYMHIFLECNGELDEAILHANQIPQRNLSWGDSTSALYNLIENRRTPSVPAINQE